MASRFLWSFILLVLVRPVVGAQSDPEAVELLRSALKPARVAYVGNLAVLQAGAKRPRKVDIWYAPGGRLRRDLVGPKGSITRSMIAEGESVWFYDRIRNVAWKGGTHDVELQVRGIQGFDLVMIKSAYKIISFFMGCFISAIRNPLGGSCMSSI